ncbi:MAG: MSEP-CTERM sorting domain-containing protein [Fibromonadales bacterium]|nr:MSEP-CTERM sorting domain-containing protein [Fibromonadales bacterium]
MRNLFNPKLLFIINTLPLAALFILNFEQFNIIKTLLNENMVRNWKIFGFALGTLGFFNFIYAVYLVIKKKSIHPYYGFIALPCHIAFIYFYYFNLSIGNIISFNIPLWMLSDNLYLYVLTFLMPTLAYSLLILVIYFTSDAKEHKAWKNFAITVSIPVAVYFFSQIALPILSYSPSDDFVVHVSLVLFIAITLIFFFFLARSLFIVVVKKAIAWQKYQLIWKIIIAIVLPLLGLSVVNKHSFEDFVPGNMIGDFSNGWFYILAIINGILICLPSIENKLYRLLLFIGRSITLAYTFYFFLVFLPLLPFSILCIIAFGVGFLMLTPLLLFFIHAVEISKDFKYLKSWISPKIAIGIAMLGFAAIPACITVSYMKDRSVLHEALEYLYAPDYSKQYNIDENSLQKTLTLLSYHKSKRDFATHRRIPYLTSHFNWIVLDNLTLSDAKINYAAQVFLGAQSNSQTKCCNVPRNSDNVRITGISAESVYDESQKAWKSWVNLEITNENEFSNFAEYSTTIDLPEGTWISDYYLYVGNQKEMGILSEKKSAMWIYSNIRRDNLDPGILYYLKNEGNKVEFKVFPFQKNEIRKTGIEFLHKEPVKLVIDNNIIELGNATASEIVETEYAAYISAEQKQKLKSVQRKPYFHFLIDKHSSKERIEKVLASYPLYSENAQIDSVKTKGFYLERSIEIALFKAYKNKSYPIIVVVSDSIQNAILDKKFANFKFAFPESDLFFRADKNGLLHPHSLTSNPKQQLPCSTAYSFDQTVLEYKFSDGRVAYLPNNNEPSIALKSDLFEISEPEIKEKSWQFALALHAKQMSQTLHPEITSKEWRNLVKYSFISKIMTPETSYLVVENEAQKAMLKKKQEQILSGSKLLDPDEDTQQMSEPSLWLLMILFGLVLSRIRLTSTTLHPNQMQQKS